MDCRILLPGGLAREHHDGVKTHLRRCGPTLRCSLEPLRSAKGLPAKQARAKEGKAILDALPRGWTLLALDEHGTSLTTTQLAKQLGAWRDSARKLAFAVGSAHGLDDAVLSQASFTLSLSPLTLQHDLAVRVLAEQLYRVASILRGSPYHRDR